MELNNILLSLVGTLIAAMIWQVKALQSRSDALMATRDRQIDARDERLRARDEHVSKLIDGLTKSLADLKATDQAIGSMVSRLDALAVCQERIVEAQKEILQIIRQPHAT